MASERRTFTKTIDGRVAVAYATTPADAVRLRFNGWREQREPAAKPTTTPQVPVETPAQAATQPAARVQKPTAEPAKPDTDAK